MNWLLASIGFITGFLIGLTGVGGGAFIALLLMFVIGMPTNTTVGTSLIFAALTKIVAGRIFHAYYLVDWTVVWVMWLGSISAAIATLAWINYLVVDGQNLALWKQIIAGAILLAIMSLFLQPTIDMLNEQRFSTEGPGLTTSQVVFTITAGMMLGALIVLTSVGVGALSLVILARLYPQRMAPANLVATNVAHAVPLALFGGVGHMFMNNVDFIILWQLLLGSIPGAIFGSLLAVSLDNARLRAVLSATLWVFGLQLWWAVLPSS